MRPDGLLRIGIGRTGRWELLHQFAVAERSEQNRQQREGVGGGDVTVGQAGNNAKGIKDGHRLQISQAHHEHDLLEQVEAQDTDGVRALPGAAALLARLNTLGIPWAIVTSGSVPVASARRQAAGLPLPAVFVTAEQVERGKPQPDAYLLGAERLGLAPQACVVVEDAAAGIASGLAAGCQVIAVNAPADAPQLEQVDLRLSSLEQLQVDGDAHGARITLRD